MIDKLLNAEASKHVAMDRIVEQYGETMRARVRELIVNPSERNPYIWIDGLDATSEGFDLAQIPERDLTWLSSYAAMVATAWRQAFVEIVLEPLLNQSDQYGERIAQIANAMSPQELKIAAKQGVGEKRREAARGEENATKD
jgi:hypothetical protein